MGAKVFADRPGQGADAEGREASADPDLEAEVQLVAAWFDALTPEWQRYFDDEATSGRRAYGQA